MKNKKKPLILILLLLTYLLWDEPNKYAEKEAKIIDPVSEVKSLTKLSENYQYESSSSYQKAVKNYPLTF